MSKTATYRVTVDVADANRLLNVLEEAADEGWLEHPFNVELLAYGNEEDNDE